MNEWLTVITSSPGPIPAAISAQCKAVVPLDTETAWGAPTHAANSRSKASASGPWVIHPDSITRRTAAISGSPSIGRATGMRNGSFIRVICSPSGVQRTARPAAAVAIRWSNDYVSGGRRRTCDLSCAEARARSHGCGRHDVRDTSGQAGRRRAASPAIRPIASSASGAGAGTCASSGTPTICQVWNSSQVSVVWTSRVYST